MKFLYVFLCLICLLNYTTFNQLGRVDEHSKMSLIKLKSLNLGSSGPSNDEESLKGTGDRPDGTGCNDSSSSSSSLNNPEGDEENDPEGDEGNDPEGDEGNDPNPFAGVSLSSPRPRRRNPWRYGNKGKPTHSNSESDGKLGPFDGANLKSPRLGRRRPRGRGNQGGSSNSGSDSGGDTSPFGDPSPRPPSPYKTTPRCSKLKGRF